MKKNKFLKLGQLIMFCCTFLFQNSLKAQLSEKPVQFGALCFESSTMYENFLGLKEDDKIKFYDKLNNLEGFTSLKKAILENNNNSSIPVDIIEDIELIQNLINQQGVIKIGKFFYKIDYNSQKVFSIDEAKAESHFEDFLSGNITEENGIGSFDINDNVIDLVENGFKRSFSQEEEIPNEGERFRICWRGSRARNNNFKTATYFYDESSPDFSVFTKCTNNVAEGPSTNTRLKIKMQYLSLGIYHIYYIKGKLQRQFSSGLFVCPGINSDELWCTVDQETGETRWNLNYTVKFKGRCRGHNEENETNTLRPPMNRENKTRKVFWERSRGLAYYCLSSDADLFTRSAFTGPGNHQRFCTDGGPGYISTTPRMINTKEIFNGQRFQIQDQTDPCR
jgi:hypothetical protein